MHANKIAIRRVQKFLVYITLALTVSIAQGETTSDDIFHHRAMESVFWSVPLVQLKIVRDSLVDGNGLGFNGVGYYSQIQNWKMQMATPNGASPPFQHCPVDAVT